MEGTVHRIRHAARRLAVVSPLSALLFLAATRTSAAPPPTAPQAVFVVSNDQILEYTTNGVLLRVLTGGPAGSFRALTFGADGFLYVTNNFTCASGAANCNELEKFNPNTGAYLGAVGSITPNTNPFSGLTNGAVTLTGLTLGPGNDLYVTTNQDGLYQIDPIANTTTPISTADCCGLGVAFLPDGTPLSIGNQNSVRNDLTGASFSTGSFTSPQALAFGPDGRLYVLEYHQIDTVPATGGAYTPLTASNALGLGSFMTFDSQGNIWVSDSGVEAREFSSVTGQQIGGFSFNGASEASGIAVGPLSGTVWAWGDNSTGELGNGSHSASSTPVQVSGLPGVIAIASGWTHSLALKADGTVWAWGSNDSGELGNNDNTFASSATPVQVMNLSGVVAIAAGDHFSLAIKSDGTAWGWGNDESGQLGDNTSTGDPRLVPIQVANITGVVAIAAGQHFSLAITSDASLWGWGDNAYGQLGLAGFPVVPVQVSGLSGVIAVAAGEGHSLALDHSGGLWAAGHNNVGQLGDGTTTDRATFVPVSGLTHVTAIAAGAFHSLARMSDGSFWAWGDNSAGELGIGNTAGSDVPAQVTTLAGATAFAAGDNFSLALKSDGSVWAWGSNSNGQLGDGTTTNRLAPVQAGGLPPTAGISAGSSFSLALTAAPLGPASLAISAPAAVTMGTAFSLTVTALDASKNPVTTYTGTVHFTSTDPLAVLPADYTFTVGDGGTHVFSATLGTAGSQTISATDTTVAALHASSNAIAVTALPVATHFAVSAPSSATAGTAFSFTATALDASNSAVTAYAGTVHFTSTDPLAVLPADYTFTAGDGGTHLFSATLGTAGSQTITIADTAMPAVSGVSNSVVVATPPVFITVNETFHTSDAQAPNLSVPEKISLTDVPSVTPLANLPTTVTLSALPAVSGYPGYVNLVASVQSASGYMVTGGAVTFLVSQVNGGCAVSIPPVALVNGTANASAAQMCAGSYAVTATYSGSVTFAGSTTAVAAPVSVSQAPTSVSLTSSAAISSGGAISFTATVSSSAGSPTGNVAFVLNGTIQGARNLSDGVATFTTTSLPFGQDVITAVYSGDTNFASSVSPGVAVDSLNPQQPNGYRFTFPIDFPGASQTEIMGIDGSRTMVGFYKNSTGTHGFYGQPGSFTSLDAPFPTTSLTAALGIGNDGSIVGRYLDGAGEHGFQRDYQGNFTSIDVSQLPCPDNGCPIPPNSAISTVLLGTSNNYNGQIFLFGFFTDATGQPHGVLIIDDSDPRLGYYINQEIGSAILALDPAQLQLAITGPGQFQAAWTIGNPYDPQSFQSIPVAVPGAGMTVPFAASSGGGPIVGFYTDAANGVSHGFIQQWVNGNSNYTTVDVPGALSTQIHWITNDGVIVGFYTDALGTHGFEAVPAQLLTSSQIKVTASGLIYSRATQSYNDTITLTNASASAISGPFQVVIVRNPAISGNFTLANASGFYLGNPVLTVPGVDSLAPGQSVTLTVQLSAPLGTRISFTVQVFTGGL